MSTLYVITQEYYDEYPELADAGFAVGDLVEINDAGHLAKTNADPVLPPPQRPPILP